MLIVRSVESMVGNIPKVSYFDTHDKFLGLVDVTLGVWTEMSHPYTLKIVMCQHLVGGEYTPYQFESN